MDLLGFNKQKESENKDYNSEDNDSDNNISNKDLMEQDQYADDEDSNSNITSSTNIENFESIEEEYQVNELKNDEDKDISFSNSNDFDIVSNEKDFNEDNIIMKYNGIEIDHLTVKDLRKALKLLDPNFPLSSKTKSVLLKNLNSIISSQNLISKYNDIIELDNSTTIFENNILKTPLKVKSIVDSHYSLRSSSKKTRNVRNSGVKESNTKKTIIKSAKKDSKPKSIKKINPKKSEKRIPIETINKLEEEEEEEDLVVVEEEEKLVVDDEKEEFQNIADPVITFPNGDEAVNLLLSNEMQDDGEMQQQEYDVDVDDELEEDTSSDDDNFIEEEVKVQSIVNEIIMLDDDVEGKEEENSKERDNDEEDSDDNRDNTEILNNNNDNDIIVLTNDDEEEIVVPKKDISNNDNQISLNIDMDVNEDDKIVNSIKKQGPLSKEEYESIIQFLSKKKPKFAQEELKNVELNTNVSSSPSSINKQNNHNMNSIGDKIIENLLPSSPSKSIINDKKLVNTNSNGIISSTLTPLSNELRYQSSASIMDNNIMKFNLQNSNSLINNKEKKDIIYRQPVNRLSLSPNYLHNDRKKRGSNFIENMDVNDNKRRKSMGVTYDNLYSSGNNNLNNKIERVYESSLWSKEKDKNEFKAITSYTPTFKGKSARFSDILIQPSSLNSNRKSPALSFIKKQSLKLASSTDNVNITKNQTVASRILNSLSNITTPIEDHIKRPKAIPESSTTIHQLKKIENKKQPVSLNFESNNYNNNNNNNKSNNSHNNNQQQNKIKIDMESKSSINNSKLDDNKQISLLSSQNSKESFSNKTVLNIKNNTNSFVQPVVDHSQNSNISSFNEDKEFTFEFPTKVQGMEDVDISNDVIVDNDSYKSDIKYVFSPPRKTSNSTKKSLSKNKINTNHSNDISNESSSSTVPVSKKNDVIKEPEKKVDLWAVAASNALTKIKCHACSCFNEMDVIKCLSCETVLLKKDSKTIPELPAASINTVSAFCNDNFSSKKEIESIATPSVNIEKKEIAKEKINIPDSTGFSINNTDIKTKTIEPKISLASTNSVTGGFVFGSTKSSDIKTATVEKSVPSFLTPTPSTNTSSINLLPKSINSNSISESLFSIKKDTDKVKSVSETSSLTIPSTSMPEASSILSTSKPAATITPSTTFSFGKSASTSSVTPLIAPESAKLSTNPFSFSSASAPAPSTATTTPMIPSIIAPATTTPSSTYIFGSKSTTDTTSSINPIAPTASSNPFSFQSTSNPTTTPSILAPSFTSTASLPKAESSGFSVGAVPTSSTATTTPMIPAIIAPATTTPSSTYIFGSKSTTITTSSINPIAPTTSSNPFSLQSTSNLATTPSTLTPSFTSTASLPTFTSNPTFNFASNNNSFGSTNSFSNSQPASISNGNNTAPFSFAKSNSNPVSVGTNLTSDSRTTSFENNKTAPAVTNFDGTLSSHSSFNSNPSPSPQFSFSNNSQSALPQSVPPFNSAPSFPSNSNGVFSGVFQAHANTATGSFQSSTGNFNSAPPPGNSSNSSGFSMGVSSKSNPNSKDGRRKLKVKR
jgi:hypothetical protein